MSAPVFSQSELEREGIKVVESVPKPPANKSKPSEDGGRKKPHIYSASDDISILNEIIAERAFGKGAAKKWKTIHEHLDIPVSDGEALKRRYDTLLKHFNQQNVKSLKGSGLEEEYTLKMQLLQETKDLKESIEAEERNNEGNKDDKTQEEDKEKAEKDVENAKAVRDAATKGLIRKNTDDSPTTSNSKRTKRDEMLKLMEKSDDRDHQLKAAKQEQEDKRLALQDKELILREREVAMKEEEQSHAHKLALRRMELEETKTRNDAERAKAELEERKLFLALLQQQLNRN